MKKYIINNLAKKTGSLKSFSQQRTKFLTFTTNYIRFNSWNRDFNQKSSGNFETGLITRQDGTLASNSDFDGIYDLDDKFNLAKITDAKKIFSLLNHANYNYKLNDLIYFLRRIVQINDTKILKLDLHNADLATLVKKVKDSLREGTQEYPLIGSYAWCFWKLGIKNDQELWLTLGDHIVDDRFYPNFKESVYAIEGFTCLRDIAEPSLIEEIYKKLERICILTIWEVNMTYYKRIAESLVQVGRFTPYVFNKLENHIMNNLSMEYELKTMLDILFAFALSGNGSKEFYNAMELVMVKGHMFNRMFHLQLHSELPSNADFTSKLIETYALAKARNPELVFEPDFRSLCLSLITSKKIQYRLEDLVRVMQHYHIFEFEEIEEINKFLEKKFYLIDDIMDPEDMVRYIDLIVMRDNDGDYSQIDKKVLVHFDEYLNKNLSFQNPEKMYVYISEIENRNLMAGKKELLNNFVNYVSKEMNSYDFEAMCYYFWLFNKYQDLIDMKSKHIQHSMSQIKDHIRLYSAFSKGKLRIGSNFYKMLEVVSGADFLTQGEYPEW